MRLDRGTLVLVDLDPTLGHEQAGSRPAIVVSDPEVSADQRYPLLGVVPVTRTPGAGALYPRLEPGKSGLRQVSWALVDQVRSIDKRRVERIYGAISTPEMRAVDSGLALFFCLRVPAAPEDDADPGNV